MCFYSFKFICIWIAPFHIHAHISQNKTHLSFTIMILCPKKQHKQVQQLGLLVLSYLLFPQKGSSFFKSKMLKNKQTNTYFNKRLQSIFLCSNMIVIEAPAESCLVFRFPQWRQAVGPETCSMRLPSSDLQVTLQHQFHVSCVQKKNLANFITQHFYVLLLSTYFCVRHLTGMETVKYVVKANQPPSWC